MPVRAVERLHVAVIGGGSAGQEDCDRALRVGRALARAGAVVITGGLGGVMEAAGRGARHAGGINLAILPGNERQAANVFVDVAVASGLGEGRNLLVVRNADSVVAVGGEFGTLSEIALALQAGVPVIGLGTWELAKAGEPPRPGVIEASSPEEAAELALQEATRRRRRR